jgi:hypothetical protein
MHPVKLGPPIPFPSEVTGWDTPIAATLVPLLAAGRRARRADPRPGA